MRRARDLRRREQSPRVGWKLLQPKVPLDLVELPPVWCRHAESALTHPPAFVVGWAQTVPPAGRKPQFPDIAECEVRKHPRIQVEPQDQSTILNPNHWVRRSRLGIPALVQFLELGASAFHASIIAVPHTGVPQCLSPCRHRSGRVCIAGNSGRTGRTPAGACLRHPSRR